MKGVTTTHTILDKIMAHKVTEIAHAQRQTPLGELRNRLGDVSAPLNFTAALCHERVALIAEVKKASPSKGVFLADFDPVAIAREYARYGASAISVLTDEHFFQGHLDYLRQIKAAVNVPVLRKEFVLDEYQVIEARVAGADAVLLIAACLEDNLMQDLYSAITDLSMTALVEVHDESEMERALRLNPQVVGINNRNLHDFSLTLETTVNLAKLCPPEITLVGESGIHTAADVEYLATAGVHAILVGESLILADDRPSKIQELSGVRR
jgi:indole-3-glycerol phosphate synthase